MYVVEIQQKLTEQEHFLVSYFENNADWAALVGFWFWIENQNCETILVEMVIKLINPPKSNRMVLYNWYNFEYTTLSTQNIDIPLFFDEF